MAGFYADVPNYKMPTDKDGSQLFIISTPGAVTNATSTQMNQMTQAILDYPTTGNQCVPDPVGSGGGRAGKVAWVFPEKRDLTHVMVVTNKLQDLTRPAGCILQTSLDTTNGLDGTWSTVATYTPPVVVVPNYRTTLQNCAVNNVKGVRVMDDGTGSFQMGVSCFHVYGTTTVGENPDRLAMWHPTLDQELSASAFDWGDVPRSTTATKTFRVKNLSATLTANTPRAAMSVLQDATPSLVTAHALSSDNATWVAQVTLSNLAPGAISPVLYFKRDTPANAQGGVHLMRVFAEATTWS